ncbi:MAG: stage III sporulation protein AA [Lachnospiraceae bacterium]|nr:stage III sporulation protein AA [Lachnospiraceae bacterium]
MQFESVCRLLAAPLARVFADCALDIEKLQEIRLRVGRPLLVRYDGQEYALGTSGKLSANTAAGCRITEEDLKETLECVSGYSLYAFDEEVRQGFLTVSGGHRVGLVGHAVMDGERIQSLRSVSSLNIRLSHQVRGCADPLLPWLYEEGEVCSTLILSPPGGGKTTLLRDLIHQISDGSRYGEGRTTGVVDERSELAGSYLGVPQNDLGLRTDVLDGCRKAEGMMLLLRSMAPEVIAVDELGGETDGEAIEHVFTCGCRLLATVHGASMEEVKRKPLLKRLLREQLFDRYVVLAGREKPGEVREIRDREGKILLSGSEGTDVTCNNELTEMGESGCVQE